MLIRRLNFSLGAAIRFWFALWHRRLGRLDCLFRPTGALLVLVLEVVLVVRLVETATEGPARLVLAVTDAVVPLVLIQWSTVELAARLTERAAAAAVFEALHFSVRSIAVEAAAEVVRFAADFVLIFALEAAKKECTTVAELDDWDPLRLHETESAGGGFGFLLAAAAARAVTCLVCSLLCRCCSLGTTTISSTSS
jgi:hypothetical protein